MHGMIQQNVTGLEVKPGASRVSAPGFPEMGWGRLQE